MKEDTEIEREMEWIVAAFLEQDLVPPHVEHEVRLLYEEGSFAEALDLVVHSRREMRQQEPDQSESCAD